MNRSFIHIFWRNIIKNKSASFINVGGLAVGMTVSFMLLLYVHNEYSFDKFHANGDRIYQVFKNQLNNGTIKTTPFMPQPLASALKKDFPEIADVARTSVPSKVLVASKDTRLKLNMMVADPELLNMFNFDFIYGNKGNALSDGSSIVLTESGAKALFGNIDPVGQVVTFDDRFPMRVAAVLKNNPQNSSFDFEALIPWQALLAQQPWMKEVGWDNYSYYSYILLKSNTQVTTVNSKIRNLIGRYYPLDKNIELFLYPFARLHLYGNFKNGVNAGGSIEYVQLFFLLAIGILVIACINFMNLSTARSEHRAREVGIRKAIGASRITLIQQFMIESLLMAFLALVLSLIPLILLLPVFANFIKIQLILPYRSPVAWEMVLTITLLTGLFAGSYPALFLSSFNPVKVLKGKSVLAKSPIRLRQGLVVLQFTFATCLILSSLIIYKQLDFIKSQPVGYNRSGLIEMPVDGSMYKKFESFRQDAINAGAITDGAIISNPITSVGGSTWDMAWPGQLPGENKLSIDCIAVTYHFINTYQLELMQGRDFAMDRPSDSSAVILNEAAVQLMRLKSPLGQKIKWLGIQRTVIGVVKNFVWGSPYEPVKPAVIGFMKDWIGSIGLRLNPRSSVSESLSLLQTLYKQHNQSFPFEYTFTDESFDKKFNNEKILGSMSISFTCLAIIISCLGLFGLASFSAEQRKKEISIRKVLGASIKVIWFKLSQEFIGLVFLSFIIGSAISLYTLQQWLSRYFYHTSLSAWVFALTMIISLGICLVAVSWQAIKAARVNPVKNLKGE